MRDAMTPDGELVHVTAGERGKKGDTGDTGVRGEMGPAYSSWVTRHVLMAYLMVVIGTILSFVLTVYLFNRTLDEVDHRAKQNCEAGNKRSALQVEDFRSTRQQTINLDIGRLLGISPADVDEVRRITIENSNRRIASVPFVDCSTGKPLPAAKP